MSLALGSRLAHYQVLAAIGTGGMGEIYRALDTKLERTVALKILPVEVSTDSDRMQRFLQEAKLASSLNHPNAAHVYEIGDSEGVSFIAMEYVDGETLQSKITGRFLQEAEIIDIAIQVADALAAAHHKGIIHRDIKPSNIMITAHGQVKVLDFGLAKKSAKAAAMHESELSTQMLTEPGVVMGTVRYMSPEQALGRPLDHRTDIFSLGTALYQMATGKLPFHGATPSETIDRIVHAQPGAIARFNYDISTELDWIIRKCLEKDPNGRYQSAKDLVADLKRLRSNVEFQVASRATVLPPVVRRRWIVPAFFLLVFVALLALLPMLHRSFDQDVRPETTTRHLAVLPFRIIGADSDLEALSNGLIETTTSALTQLNNFQGPLWIIPASDVYARGISSVQDARKAFGATMVVTGSARRQDDRIQLTLNLVDAATLRQLKSGMIDHRGDISKLQDEIVVKLADMLGLELQPGNFQGLAVGRTVVPGVFEFYLQGRGYLRRYDKPENLDTAIDLLERTLDEDPGYALAYAGLGEAYWLKYRASSDIKWVEPALKACERAVKLNSKLPEVYVTLGVVYKGTGRYEEAIRELKKALALHPRNADAYRELAGAYQAVGDLKAAESTYQKAIRLLPDYWAGYNSLGAFYYDHGRLDEAVTQWKQVVALTPDNLWGYNNLGALYIQLERWDDARQMFERAIRIQPDYAAYSNLGTIYFGEGRYADAATMYEKALQLNSQAYKVWGNLAAAYYWMPGKAKKAAELYKQAAQMGEARRRVNPRDGALLSTLAEYYAMLSERAKSLALLKRALELAPQDVHVMYRVGSIYEQLGDRDAALRWVGRALKNGYSRALVERSPGLRKLREDPRFKDMAQTDSSGRKLKQAGSR